MSQTGCARSSERAERHVRRIRLLAAVIGLAVGGLGVGASLAHATTTTSNPATYDYDHPVAYAQGANGSTLDPAGPPRLRGARLHGDLRFLRFVGRGGAAAESETSLYRAVSSAERADIESFGGFRQAPSGLSYEGKLFATTPEDTARYGRINYGIDRKPFHIVEARVPTSFAQSLYSGTADSMRYVSVGPEQLGQFNGLARINIWNQVPWVARP
jgi:hypothetical protein